MTITVPGQLARRWDELTAGEQTSVQTTNLLDFSLTLIRPQIQGWNKDRLTPQSLSVNYHLDLNRFIKVQSGMKILSRRLDRS